MSSKFLTVQDIQAVGELLKDKAALEILKEIRDNAITKDDVKGKKSDNYLVGFVGFTSGEDILEEDKDSDEYKVKRAKIRSLVDSGLVIEGAYIPLEKGENKGHGDVKFPDPEGKIYKFQLSNEGFTLLKLSEEKDGNGNGGGGTSASKPRARKSLSRSEENNGENKATNDKAKNVAEFKESQKKEIGIQQEKNKK